MSKFGVIVEKSERTLFKELGIKKRAFLESLREQRERHEGTNRLYPRIHGTLTEIYDQALYHLRELEAFAALPEIAPLVQEAIVRVEALKAALPPRRKRYRPRRDIEAEKAAAKLYDLLRGGGRAQIGYYGALALFYLGLDPLKPGGTDRRDSAVNRFWAHYNTGKTLPELTKEHWEGPGSM